MKFRLTEKSQNRKTGPMAVISASHDTCPHSCPFIDKGCYGKVGPMCWHWNKDKFDVNGVDWHIIMYQLQALPEGTVVRYGDVGDLPGDGETIYYKYLESLIWVVKQRRLKLFTYTHYLGTEDKHIRDLNIQTIQHIHEEFAGKDYGITVNISTEDMKMADELCSKGWPVTCTIESDWHKNISRVEGKMITPKRNMSIVCPAIRNDKTTCSNCGKSPLCFRKGQRKNLIICFPAHGPGKKHVDKVIGGTKYSSNGGVNEKN